MLPDGRRLGAHLPLAAGMVKAADRANEIGAKALQIFSDNPTSWRRRAEPPKELPQFRERLLRHDIAPVAIHAAYLVNLAGPEPEFFDGSVAMLAHELRGAPSFGARYVNVHIGSHRGAGVEAGVRRLAEGVARTLDAVHATPDAPMLILENASGSGAALGADIDELAAIAEAIGAAGVPRGRVGFCLDTAHAWGAGVDLRVPAVIDAFLAEFDLRIGLDRLVMVHLNDSRSERGSRLDRHEHLGAGEIGPAALAYLLVHPALRHTTYILETPGMDEGYDAINLARAVALAEGRPLDSLPEGALDVRSSRARTAPP